MLTAHHVLPQHVEQYKELIAGYYDGIAKSKDFDCRLTGSWEIEVGEIDTFGELPSSLSLNSNITRRKEEEKKELTSFSFCLR